MEGSPDYPFERGESTDENPNCMLSNEKSARVTFSLEKGTCPSVEVGGRPVCAPAEKVDLEEAHKSRTRTAGISWGKASGGRTSPPGPSAKTAKPSRGLFGRRRPGVGLHQDYRKTSK